MSGMSVVIISFPFCSIDFYFCTFLLAKLLACLKLDINLVLQPKTERDRAISGCRSGYMPTGGFSINLVEVVLNMDMINGFGNVCVASNDYIVQFFVSTDRNLC
jgi:hypothetical protein